MTEANIVPDAASNDDYEPLLVATGLKKSFSGVPALLDGQISLRPGSVHALLGGNGAGKSTFLNMLMGILKPDGGTIKLRGKVVSHASAAEALADGISIITQELSPIADMTVAENIFLGREPTRGKWFVDNARMEHDAAQLFERIGFEINPGSTMRSLSVAQHQLVEIAKAISWNSDVIIMDEPTSALGDKETEILFETIRSLKKKGVGIIYVSHRLTDIFSIADEYTVLRDGHFVENGPIENINRESLIALIVGAVLGEGTLRNPSLFDEVMLEAVGYTSSGKFQDIDLKIHRGEILGIYGLMGAGRSEFANALFGSEPKSGGQLKICGKPVEIRNPRDALDHGMAIITEDRKESGLVLTSSVAFNISLASIARLAKFGIVQPALENRAVERQVQQFSVKTASNSLEVNKLSGGNQQKVVFARCVETGPRILICDEPTRGIDEASKREIYAFLSEFASEGNAVLLISSEVPEVIANSDRIVVFNNGQIVGEVSGQDADQKTLVHLAS